MGGTNSTIKECYNTGTIKSTGTVANGNSNAAGILASFTSAVGTSMTIQNCHNVGNIEAVNAPYRSGLFQRTVNNLKITMTSCFALNEDSKSQNSGSDADIAGGSSSYRNLSSAEMKNTSSFTGWDFSTVWQMGNEYPTLQALSR